MVDDDPGVRRLACQVLERAGYRTAEASDGRQALALISQHPSAIGLVLSDVRMPNLDGIELAQVAAQRWPNLPIVLMSGEITREWIVSTLGSKSIFVLRKPFLREELLETIRELLAAPLS